MINFDSVSLECYCVHNEHTAHKFYKVNHSCKVCLSVDVEIQEDNVILRHSI